MNGRILGIVVGALFVVAALFSPVVSLPIIGNQSFLSLFGIEAAALAIAVVALLYFALIARGEFGLWASSAAIAALALWSAVSLMLRLQGISKLALDQPSDGLAASLQRVAVESITPQWGWSLLVIGVIVICGATALVHGEPAESELGNAERSLLEFPASARVPVVYGIGFALLVAIGPIALSFASQIAGQIHAAKESARASVKVIDRIDKGISGSYFDVSGTSVTQVGLLWLKNNSASRIQHVTGVIHVFDDQGAALHDFPFTSDETIERDGILRLPIRTTYEVEAMPDRPAAKAGSFSATVELTGIKVE